LVGFDGGVGMDPSVWIEYRMWETHT